jgi:hypothetical protein
MPFAREMAWSLPGGLIRQPWRFLTTTLTKLNILSESTKLADAKACSFDSVNNLRKPKFSAMKNVGKSWISN